MSAPKERLLSTLGKGLKEGRSRSATGEEIARVVLPSPHAAQKTPRGEVSRLENDPRVEAFIKKMETKEAKAIYKQRSEVAEFPNAWIKDKFGLRQFRLRGLVKVGIEALWACFTYNIKLWIRLCWKPRLQAAE